MIPARLAPLLEAERLRSRGDAAGAMAAYADILDDDPRCAPALIALGCLHIQATDPVRAQTLLLRACDAVPDDWQAWDALGIALAMTGDARPAATAFGRAIQLAPDPIPLAARLIDAVVASGDVAAETARQDATAALCPLDPLPLLLAGLLHAVAGDLMEALDRLEAATVLAPDNAVLARTAADMLVRAGQPRAAVAAFQRAVALTPDDLAVRNNLGAMLCRAHRHAEAETVLRAVLDEGGPRADALSNLANALCSQGRQVEAVAIARAAVAANPALSLPRRTLTTTLCYAPGIAPAELLAAAGAASALLPRPSAPSARHAPGTPLRVGLLPATLRTHPVGWLTIAAFEALDPARIHLVVLAPDEVDDPMRQRFRAAAGTWVPVRPATDAAFAQAARDQKLDVLIDLGGGGEGGHLGACAERLAPVQLKWVGSQGHSTGLAEMDGFVSDRWETPAGFDQDYSERLLRMPDGYCVYSPPAHAPAVAALPALARGGITFGCLNNLAKITPEAIALWSAILRRLPTARLLVQAQALDETATADAFRARFAAHGIGGQLDGQLELRGGLAHRAMLATYGQIDIALDPFPYSGGLSTCEALWMGVPTLTMPGTSFASRHSLSHMSNVGLGDWAVADVAGYLDAALARAGDVSALATLRAGLRERVRTSPLCDGPKFANGLTAMLEDAVSRG